MAELKDAVPHRSGQEVPNCWQCHHFAISWDPARPYSCRLMGFKTRVQPSLEVLRVDGERCRGFVLKAIPVGSGPATTASASRPRAGVSASASRNRPQVWEA